MGYKHDAKAKQTAEQAAARWDLIMALQGSAFADAYGIAVEAPPDLADDPSGDCLDALLCAIQAAWAWTRGDQGFGLPEHVDPLEGWIADPHVRAA